MMSPSKKRRKQESRTVVEPFGVGTREIFNSADIPNFSVRCKDELKRAMLLLNKTFQEKVQLLEISETSEHPHHRPVHIRDLVGEYLRIEREIRSRYEFSATVVAFGSDDSSQLGLKPGAEDEDKATENYPTLADLRRGSVRQVSAGGTHSVALLTNGDVYTWGNGDGGLLGRFIDKNDEFAEVNPRKVTGFHTGSSGGLPGLAKEDERIIQVAAGNSYTSYLSEKGNVFVSGFYKDMDSGTFRDTDGQGDPRGHNETPEHVSRLPSKVNLIAGSTDGSFIAVRLDDGNDTIMTWGFGNSGELARSADMTTADKNGDYDVGRSFFYDKVYDENGKQNGDEVSFSKVNEHFLCPKQVRFAGSVPYPKKKVISIACGQFHLLVAARDPGLLVSQLYSSGLNQYGQLGHGYAGKESLHELTRVESLKNANIAAVAAGNFHSLALSLDGTKLYSFGSGRDGQLGIGVLRDDEETQATPKLVAFPEREILGRIDAGGNLSFGITLDGDVYSWGFATTGATGHETDDDVIYVPQKLDYHSKVFQIEKQIAATAIDVSAGGQHAFLLVKEEKVA